LKITVGMFGLGRTGSVVAHEIMNDEGCELKWVLRRSHQCEGQFASRVLGNEGDYGLIYSIDSIDPDAFYKDNFVDVIIDFSASSAVENYKHAPKYGTRIVSAISKYEKAQLAHLKQLGSETAVLYSPNITLGINFLIEVSKILQRIVPHADIEIVEEHFKGKPDISGTALRIAEDLGLDQKEHVNSLRVGGIVGKHTVVFGLPNQMIRIVHESLNRAAFGQGAIYAAKWLMGKGPGVYTMEEAVMLSAARNLTPFDDEA